MNIQFSILTVIQQTFIYLTQHNISLSDIFVVCFISVIFPSTAVEWQPVESLSGTFKAIHKGIADVMYADKPPSFYKSVDLFVYFAEYRVPSREGVHGELYDIPIPTIMSLEWEAPDPNTITSFKSKIKDDILKAMSPGRISRRIKLQWFLPIHVFVECFKTMELERTRTMWLNRRLSLTDLDTVLGEGWSTKETFHMGDNISCRVSPNSLSISYQLCRQSLVLGYDYRRWKSKLGSWVPLDSEENCPEFEFNIIVHPFIDPRKLIVTSNWRLQHVRESLEFLDEISPEYRFKVDDIVIRTRMESVTSCITCLPPKKVVFEPLARASLYS